MKALRKVPEARYPTVAALADDVRRWLDALPVSAGRDAWRYRASQLVRRHGTAIGIAAAVIIAIAVTAVIASRSATPALDTVTLPQHPRYGRRLPSRASPISRNAGRCMVVHRDGRDADHRAGRRRAAAGGAGRADCARAARAGRRDCPHRRPHRSPAECAATQIRGDRIVRHERRAGGTPRAHRRAGDAAGRRSGCRVGVGQRRGTLHVDGRRPAATFASGWASNAPRRPRRRRRVRRSRRTSTPTRLYAEGLARLRELDAVRAQELLEKAAAPRAGQTR